MEKEQLKIFIINFICYQCMVGTIFPIPSSVFCNYTLNFFKIYIILYKCVNVKYFQNFSLIKLINSKILFYINIHFKKFYNKYIIKKIINKNYENFPMEHLCPHPVGHSLFRLNHCCIWIKCPPWLQPWHQV